MDDVTEDVTDDDLVGQMKRVRSDLSFRKWTRKRIFLSLCLIFVDLLTTALSVYAISLNRNLAVETCKRDNVFREAYVNQWKPILTLPPLSLPAGATPEVKAQYNAQEVLRIRFNESLTKDFAIHPC